MIRDLFVKYRQIILYLFFGATTTVVNWCVYVPMHQVLRLNMTVSNAVAWFCAVGYAFITNKLFVFESKSMAGKVLLQESVKFFGSRVLSGAVEVLLPTALYAIGINQTLFGVQGGIAKALVSVLIIVLNYIFSKFLVFRRK